MTREEILAMMQNMPKQPEQKIGPIPKDNIGELLKWDDEKMGMSQQDLLEMILPFGVMGKIAKTVKGVIPYITGRNVKAVKNIKAHQNIDKLMKNADYKELLKLNPGSKIDFSRRGIKLPDAKSGSKNLSVGEKVFPSSRRPENLLEAMILMLASPLIGKNLVDVGYGKLGGEPLNIGLPPKQR